MRRECLPATAVLLVLAAGTSAVELADLRVGLGVGPLASQRRGEITRDDGRGYSYEEHFDGVPGVAGHVSVTWGRLDPIGLLWGIDMRGTAGQQKLKGVVADGTSYVATGTSLTYDQSEWALSACGGIGYAFGTGWHLECVAMAGPAWMRFESLGFDPETDAPDETSGQGQGYAIGARMGLYWTASDNWQYGVETTWSRTVCDGHVEYASAHAKFDDITSQGFGAMLSIGYRY